MGPIKPILTVFASCGSGIARPGPVYSICLRKCSLKGLRAEITEGYVIKRDMGVVLVGLEWQARRLVRIERVDLREDLFHGWTAYRSRRVSGALVGAAGTGFVSAWATAANSSAVEQSSVKSHEKVSDHELGWAKIAKRAMAHHGTGVRS